MKPSAERAGSSSQNPIERRSVPPRQPVPLVVERAHAGHQRFQAAGAVHLFKGGPESRQVRRGGMRRVEGEPEGFQHVAQFAGTISLVVIAVADEGEFIEGQAQRQQGLRPAEVFPGRGEAAGIPSPAIRCLAGQPGCTSWREGDATSTISGNFCSVREVISFSFNAFVIARSGLAASVPAG